MSRGVDRIYALPCILMKLLSSEGRKETASISSVRSTATLGHRVRVMMIGFVLPRPAMLDLEMQEDAEEGADDDDQAKDHDVVQGGIYNNSVNDVASHKELEPEQNRSSHILATKTVCVNRVAFSPKEKSNRGDGRSNDHDGDASGLYRGANNFNDLSEMFHKTQI